MSRKIHQEIFDGFNDDYGLTIDDWYNYFSNNESSYGLITFNLFQYQEQILSESDNVINYIPQKSIRTISIVLPKIMFTIFQEYFSDFYQIESGIEIDDLVQKDEKRDEENKYILKVINDLVKSGYGIIVDDNTKFCLPFDIFRQNMITKKNKVTNIYSQDINLSDDIKNILLEIYRAKNTNQKLVRHNEQITIEGF